MSEPIINQPNEGPPEVLVKAAEEGRIPMDPDHYWNLQEVITPMLHNEKGYEEEDRQIILQELSLRYDSVTAVAYFIRLHAISVFLSKNADKLEEEGLQAHTGGVNYEIEPKLIHTLCKSRYHNGKYFDYDEIITKIQG